MMIADWRQAWRLYSVRVSAIGATVFGLLLVAPQQALDVWNALPPEIRDMLPNAKQLGAALFFAAAIARVVRQSVPAASSAPIAAETPNATRAVLGLAAITAPAWKAAAAAPCSRKITDLVVHCAATPAGKPFFAADIRRWHKAQGWSDIGYHFVVDLDGVIEVGRAIGTAGAHVAGHNSTTIGICYVGGVAADGKTPADTRTPAQKAALLELLKTLKARFPRAGIRGHRDFPGVAKACPSFDAKREYAGLTA